MPRLRLTPHVCLAPYVKLKSLFFDVPRQVGDGKHIVVFALVLASYLYAHIGSEKNLCNATCLETLSISGSNSTFVMKFLTDTRLGSLITSSSILTSTNLYSFSLCPTSCIGVVIIFAVFMVTNVRIIFKQKSNKFKNNLFSVLFLFKNNTYIFASEIYVMAKKTAERNSEIATARQLIKEALEHITVNNRVFIPYINKNQARSMVFNFFKGKQVKKSITYTVGEFDKKQGVFLMCVR